MCRKEQKEIEKERNTTKSNGRGASATVCIAVVDVLV